MTLPVDVESAGGDEYDPRAVKLLKTIYIVTLTIEALHPETESEYGPPPVTQSYMDELVAAFKCGEELLERENKEEFLQDVSTLDDETLVEVRGTLVYAARHFGIEIDLPAPGDGGARVDE